MNQKKIMIVEDEVIVGMDLVKKVASLGYKVDSTVIRYGEDVLKAAEKVNPDLIMMDIRLKGAMDGTQAASIVRETLGLPIIFLTAYSDKITLSKAKIAEPYAYLKKPVRIDDLKISLEIVLYRAKIDREKEKLIKELENALAEVKTLRGLIPICSQCKKIRDDQGYWNILELYIEKHSEGKFSHSMCPECLDKLYGDEDWYIDMEKDNE
jgi:two-component system, response regulator PdtaR